MPALAAELPLVRVVLFGSYARGNFTAASDVDLLLVHRSVQENAYAIARRTLAFPHLEPHVYSLEEYAVNRETIERMIRGGVTIFD